MERKLELLHGAAAALRVTESVDVLLTLSGGLLKDSRSAWSNEDHFHYVLNLIKFLGFSTLDKFLAILRPGSAFHSRTSIGMILVNQAVDP
jgi:hypothetical protein